MACSFSPIPAEGKPVAAVCSPRQQQEQWQGLPCSECWQEGTTRAVPGWCFPEQHEGALISARGLVWDLVVLLGPGNFPPDTRAYSSSLREAFEDSRHHHCIRLCSIHVCFQTFLMNQQGKNILKKNPPKMWIRRYWHYWGSQGPGNTWWVHMS